MSFAPSAMIEKVKDIFVDHVNVFVYAIVDSFSIHLVLPVLLDNRAAALLTGQILLTNMVLLVGSVTVFNRGIGPLLGYVESVVEDVVKHDVTFSDQLIWLVYSGLWLVPICALCWTLSTAWYQELVDSVYKKRANKTELSKSVGNSIYGGLVWLYTFIQTNILTTLIPMTASQMNNLAEMFFFGLEMDYKLVAVRTAITIFLKVITTTSTVMGLAMTAFMYGWYGFDPQWIASDVSPDLRFTIMENHFAYFLGFGFPYMVLNKTTSFFTGFGGYLALFPFCVLLGAVLDYHKPYAKYRVAVGESDDMAVSVPVFYLAKQWALKTIQLINIFQKRRSAEKKSKSEDESTDLSEDKANKKTESSTNTTSDKSDKSSKDESTEKETKKDK